MMERGKYEGALRDVAIKEGLGVFPFYSLANGFLTGKYRSKDDLKKSVRGGRSEQYLEGKGPKVLAAKWQATVAANRVVDLACEVVGGSSYRRGKW